MSKWEISSIDGLPYNPKANKNCPVCKGHGVVDDGSNYGCILIDCPKCCSEIDKPMTDYERIVQQAREEVTKAERERCRKIEDAAVAALCILDHIASAVYPNGSQCQCDASVGWVCENCEAGHCAQDIRRAVEATQKENP